MEIGSFLCQQLDREAEMLRERDSEAGGTKSVKNRNDSRKKNKKKKKAVDKKERS